ncbi:AraC family transcriptional regulator [Dyadobacter beijingensis]|uniref:AraC family transcriptional regulator n=1 Tax=Dyadobacter beijingensis TaxID=365489 RepID=A0ABQ2IAH3_9BACT|nr:AraC family transcriptional regulator [Dyadobacter beijingensis]GGN04621.1 AraC family transcriptional regulator [Dyadobacter beijingensis]
MSTFLELKSFYKHINRSPETGESEVGHFNVFKVEDLLVSKNRPVTYSRRNFFKVSLVTGHSKIHYADQCIEVRDSALVFTNPMIPYHWERIDERQSGFVCIFTEAFFSRFGHVKDYPVFQSAGAAVISLRAEDVGFYNDLFLRMLAELEGDYLYKYDFLRTMLMELVHSAQKMVPTAGQPLSGSNAAERITALFAELLERQFPIELSNQVIRLNTPSAFAGQLNIHVNHLNKALKETTGQTTSQLISERIVQEAKILLKSTNWTINEIAWGLGFEEPNHFSSFFKHAAGVTPKQFRQVDLD